MQWFISWCPETCVIAAPFISPVKVSALSGPDSGNKDMSVKHTTLLGSPALHAGVVGPVLRNSFSRLSTLCDLVLWVPANNV